MKISLISNWKESYKFLCMWFFLILGALPEIVQLAGEYGLIESIAVSAILGKALKVIAFGGALSRLIDQKIATQKPEESLPTA